MEIKAKRHEEQQRELEEEEENSVRNYPKKVDLFLLSRECPIILGFFFKYIISTFCFIVQVKYVCSLNLKIYFVLLNDVFSDVLRISD